MNTTVTALVLAVALASTSCEHDAGTVVPWSPCKARESARQEAGRLLAEKGAAEASGCRLVEQPHQPEQGLNLKCTAEASRRMEDLLHEMHSRLRYAESLECSCLEERGEMEEAQHCRSHR